MVNICKTLKTTPIQCKSYKVSPYIVIGLPHITQLEANMYAVNAGKNLQEVKV